jgi:hypothetical protein
VIDGKVWEIRYSRTTSIGIIRLCGIQNIDQIVPCGVISLADGKKKSALAQRDTGGGVQLGPGSYKPALRFWIK